MEDWACGWVGRWLGGRVGGWLVMQAGRRVTGLVERVGGRVVMVEGGWVNLVGWLGG